MSISQEGTKWIEAAKLLSSNPEAIVTCPACEYGHLIVKDIPIDKEEKMDRYMICESCEKYNVITMQTNKA